MAKKKQLAGKTTKLAKLPLTQALVEQAEESGRLEAPALAAFPSHAPGEPLGAVYLHVIKELSSLLSQLQTEAGGPLPQGQALLSPHVPKPQQLRQSLRLAQQGLTELNQLLSRA